MPGGVRERDTYLPKHSPDGDFSADEIRTLVRQAERARQARHDRRRASRLPGGAPAREKNPEEAAVVDDDSLHIVVYSSGGSHIGDEVDVPSAASQVILGGRTFHMFSLGGEEVLTRAVKGDEIAALQRSLKGVVAESQKREDQDVRILPVMFDSGGGQ